MCQRDILGVHNFSHATLALHLLLFFYIFRLTTLSFSRTMVGASSSSRLLLWWRWLFLFLCPSSTQMIRTIFLDLGTAMRTTTLLHGCKIYRQSKGSSKTCLKTTIPARKSLECNTAWTYQGKRNGDLCLSLRFLTVDVFYIRYMLISPYLFLCVLVVVIVLVGELPV